MTDNLDFQVTVGGLISSTSSDYEVQSLLGKGTFGEVTQCRKLATNETVALKMLKKKDCIEEAKREVAILKRMKELDSDKFNIVRWNDSFNYEGRYCLDFEKLDIDLYQFLQQRDFQPLDLEEIRPIVQQLATALEFLKSAGIIHADLKPENIMMVDHIRQPLRVKVIDFGLACNDPEEWRGMTLQTLWYRSPEVLLGAPFNEAIDVWSLGCIAAELLTGNVLFPVNDMYDMLRHIVYTIGKPPAHLLDSGIYTEYFFNEMYLGQETPLWIFKSALQMRRFNCVPRTITSLNDLLKASCKLSEEDARADNCDRASFADLLAKMLQVDASERITSSQILQHPFVTMSHLVGVFDNSPHVKLCTELMSICQRLSSDDGEDAAQTSNITASPAHHPDEGRHVGLSGEEQTFLQSTAIFTGNSEAAKKRKRSGGDDPDCGSRSPDTTPAKRKRSESVGAALPETGGQTSPRESPLHKRKRNESVGAALPETGGKTSPRKSVLHKRKRSESVGAAQPETGGQTSPRKSVLHQRKMDEADECTTSDGHSPAKKRSVNLNEELKDSIKIEAGSSSQTQVADVKKRKREDEEEASPDKRRRSSLDEGERRRYEQLNITVEAGSSSQTQIGDVKKRKREDEEKASPDKRRRSSLDEGERCRYGPLKRR